MRTVLAIAHNTYTEAIRQAVFIILVIGCAGLIFTSQFFTLFTFGVGNEQMNMVREMALASMTVCCLLLALFASSTVISDEIGRKTALTILCKPTRRWQFVCGKYVGIMASVLLAVLLLTAVLCLTVRVKEHRWDLGALPGAALVFAQVGVMAAISVAVAARLSAVINTLACFALFVLGHLSNYLLYLLHPRDQISNGLLEELDGMGLLALAARHPGFAAAKVAHTALPNLENFNIGSAVAVGTPVSGTYIGLASAYAVLYALAALIIGIMLFERRELA